jgi:hypothetical protein
VPQTRSVAGVVVRSRSRRRIASTSPIRAEVPSITSTICPSWPSGFGPEVPRADSQALITARIALTSAAVKAVGVRFGLCRRATPSIGLRWITSCRTASPNASRSTVLACD